MNKKQIGILVIGVVLVVIGIIGFVASSSFSKQYETDLGQLYMAADENGVKQYGGLKIVEIASILMIISGLLMIGIETAICLKRPRPVLAGINNNVNPVARPFPGTCPRCGAGIKTGHHFCTRCGFQSAV